MEFYFAPNHIEVNKIVFYSGHPPYEVTSLIEILQAIVRTIEWEPLPCEPVAYPLPAWDPYHWKIEEGALFKAKVIGIADHTCVVHHSERIEWVEVKLSPLISPLIAGICSSLEFLKYNANYFTRVS
jgi:hypothetical protein